MRKVASFLRSMKFGMILLVVILLLSLAGSFITQGNSAAWYVENFPDLHPVILMLGLDHLFSTWYFIALVALLCGNLTLCSLVRIGTVRHMAADQTARAACLPMTYPLEDGEEQKLSAYLQAARYRAVEVEDPDDPGSGGGVTVWTRNHSGFYGSFLTHLGILLIFVAGGCVLGFSDVQDYTILPDEILMLSDGTTVTVDDFHIEDETGKLDYASHLTITAPDGRVDGAAEIRVNHPHSFAGHRYYQQTYGTCGSISVRDETGAEDTFTMDEVSFLTADGETGIWYEALYAGYVQDEDGNYTLIASTDGEYDDPVYQVLVYGAEAHTPVLAFPGEEITVGAYTYTFNDPVSYPGIRVKTTSTALTGLLYAAFVVLLAGLWLCFFHAPVAVTVRKGGCAVSGSKRSDILLELTLALGRTQLPGAEREDISVPAAEAKGDAGAEAEPSGEPEPVSQTSTTEEETP